MSKWHAVTAAAADARLTHLDLRVLIRLADHLNLKRGQCNPSIDTIAKPLQASSRGVRKALRRLEAMDLIRTENGGGRHRSNNYEILSIQTRNSRATNPEPLVPKSLNPSSAQSFKETIKRKESFDEAMHKATKNKQSPLKMTTRSKPAQLGSIQKQLAAMLGDSGWDLLIEKSELTDQLCKKIHEKQLSFSAARRELLGIKTSRTTKSDS